MGHAQTGMGNIRALRRPEKIFRIEIRRIPWMLRA
jgi:hypothetical protein